MDDTTSDLQTKLRTDIADKLITEINVSAKYTKATDTTTVKVYSVVSGTASKDPITTSTVTVGQVHFLTAEETIGAAVFSHWSSDDKGESVLSVSKNYNLFIATAEEKSIYAVYLAEPGEDKEPEWIVMSDPYISATIKDNGVNKLSFTTAMSMPEGATWIGSGFMYSTASDFETNFNNTEKQTAALTVGSGAAGVKQKALTGKVANILTINLGADNTNDNRKIWVRGYLFYEDSEGNLHECYTDVVSTTFSELANK